MLSEKSEQTQTALPSAFYIFPYIPKSWGQQRHTPFMNAHLAKLLKKQNFEIDMS